MACSFSFVVSGDKVSLLIVDAYIFVLSAQKENPLLSAERADRRGPETPNRGGELMENQQAGNEPREHNEQPAEGDPSQDPTDIREHPQGPAEGADAEEETGEAGGS
jgi:hypothetical protein